MKEISVQSAELIYGAMTRIGLISSTPMLLALILSSPTKVNTRISWLGVKQVGSLWKWKKEKKFFKNTQTFALKIGMRNTLKSHFDER